MEIANKRARQEFEILSHHPNPNAVTPGRWGCLWPGDSMLKCRETRPGRRDLPNVIAGCDFLLCGQNRNLSVSSARNVPRECLWLAPQTGYEAKNWSAFASCRPPKEKRTIAAPIDLPRVFLTPSIGLSPRALAGSRPILAFSSAAARSS